MEIVALLALWIFAFATVAHAGLSAPIPSARFSEDRTRILVIRDGGPQFTDSQVDKPRLPDGSNLDFLKEFPRSGVYRFPGKELIYELDWFCLEGDLLASPDLEHLVRVNRFGEPWALKFYAHGRETASYNLSQMLRAFADRRYRPFSTWDYYDEWLGDIALKGDEVTVKTVPREWHGYSIGYHETHRFDLTSGALLSCRVFSVPLYALLILLAGLVYLLFRTLKKPKALSPLA